jgi:hydrogenase-4 membrane subunit HyfE
MLLIEIGGRLELVAVVVVIAVLVVHWWRFRARAQR